MVVLLGSHRLPELLTCKYYEFILIHFLPDYFNRILSRRFDLIGKNALCLLKFKIKYSDRGSEVQGFSPAAGLKSGPSNLKRNFVLG